MNTSPTTPPSGTDNTGATLESLITTFIMQYDQKIKIGNRRNIEAVERHKAAIQNLIAQEANKAVVAELKLLKAKKVKGTNLVQLHLIDHRIAQITADKESKE